ncbi:MAG TPA: aldehyde dehydrogenase family protein, partial [Terriglobales bacterium]|nr:aldehyde dehydrogenase family protein [Terriglobales bacterium]
MAIATVNPASGEVLKKFEALSDSQIEEKLARAAATFASYRKTPFSERARMMAKAGDALESQKEALGRLMT